MPSVDLALEEMLRKLGWRQVSLEIGAPQAPGAPGHVLPLVSGGREIGRLIVEGAGDLALVEELLPWLTIAVDNARTFGQLTRPPAQAPDAAVTARALDLTPRQSEVFAPLVRGLSNKVLGRRAHAAMKRRTWLCAFALAAAGGP